MAENTDWFPPSGEAPRTGALTPIPHVTSIREDKDGNLWVLFLIPAPDWPEAGRFRVLRIRPDEFANVPEYVDRLYYTVIEVIDPRTGQLLGSRTVPAALVSFIDDRRAAGVRQVAGGYWEMDVWQFNLERKLTQPLP